MQPAPRTPLPLQSAASTRSSSSIAAWAIFRCLSPHVSPDGKVVVANTGSDSVPTALLFENRGGRLGYSAAGIVRDSSTLDRPSLNGGLPQLRVHLENALVTEGLFPKEAHAMVETWQDSWFEEGSRLIYIVPSRT
jgi:hypothetical protein